MLMVKALVNTLLIGAFIVPELNLQRKLILAFFIYKLIEINSVKILQGLDQMLVLQVDIQM